MNNWDRMRAGKLYNADSADIAGYHEKVWGCVTNSTVHRFG